MDNPIEQWIQPDQARVNVTFHGQNGDLPDPVPLDSSDTDVRGWVSEAIRGGGIPGIPAREPDLKDYVVERFAPTEGRPFNMITVRPKTAFGFSDCKHCAQCLAKAFGWECCSCHRKA